MRLPERVRKVAEYRKEGGKGALCHTVVYSAMRKRQGMEHDQHDQSRMFGMDGSNVGERATTVSKLTITCMKQ